MTTLGTSFRKVGLTPAPWALLSQDINLARPTEEDPASFKESEDEGDGHKGQLCKDDDTAIAGVEA